jgi:hypothetical protein
MDISILIAACAVLVVAVGLYVLLPLFKESENSLDIELMAETDIDRLMDRKAAIYRNLKDLMLEYQMGRLSDEDFRQLEAGYKKDAALVLQKLDELQDLENIEESVVRATDSRKSSPEKAESVDYPVKCPSCGSDLIPGKKFCADCGYKIVASSQLPV